MQIQTDKTFVILFKIICFLNIWDNVEGLKLSRVDFEVEGRRISIEGTEETDWNSGIYYSFRGIPYAKAPIGDLRFQDPQPLDSLPEYIDARYDGHDCESILSKNGSEDCLILNVYTKNLQPKNPLPVIVFIHFGGLYIGSSLSNFIGPQILLTKDVVLVTFQYRLGSLGFLNLGTKDLPGNAGFKDQVYALRWVQKYIKHFGGNNADVTLMGYSAGGLSVSLHLVSPMSKGLFHKAIVMSGVIPPQTILPRGQQVELALRLCRQLNCTIQDSASQEDILNCLNGFSGAQISSTLRSLFVFGKDHPVYLWRPVIEKDFGQERFLTDDFYSLIKRGEFQRIPFMIGFNSGEFCTAAAEILESTALKRRSREGFPMLAPHILMFENQINSSQIAEAIGQHYSGEKYQQNWQFDSLCDMISDGLIRFGSHKLAIIMSKFTNVHAYNFAYNGDFSHLNYDDNRTARVEHMDDLMYLFRMPTHAIEKHENDAKIVELYLDFIWDFVTHGKISKNSILFPQGHMLINKEIIQQNGSNFDDAAFWESLFP